MQLISGRLKGSSLMEVITAMVIISLSLALTGVLFANVFNSSERMLRQQAWFIMNNISNKAVINKDITESEIDSNAIIVKKKSFAFDEKNGLWLVVIEAEDRAGKVLARRRVLIEIYNITTKD